MPYDGSKDPMQGMATGQSAPARKVVAVTPHNDNDLAQYARCLYVGVAGDVEVIPVGNADDAPVIFKNHPIGYLPAQVRRVRAAGTTASQILAIY